MSSDITSILQLDRKLQSRIIVAKAINGCDSSFINSCVLSHYIKNRSSVIIILCHNSLNHYQNVGLKMNYNLHKHIGSGLIDVYNLAEESVNDLINNRITSIQNHFLRIRDRVMTKLKSGNVNLILDGVSHLFDLQYSLKDVNEFCRRLFMMVANHENSLLLCHCNDAGVDDVTHIMANMLIHRAHTVLEVQTLPSGWSVDVSGHLTVKYQGQKFDCEHTMYCMDLKPTKYLFKLLDRGVKLLAPGSV